MPRRPRHATGGLVYHVMNRGARRLPLFETDEDYRLFLIALRDAQARVPLRLLSYVVMPNHWHLVVWPEHDDQLSRFMAWATGTHCRNDGIFITGRPAPGPSIRDATRPSP